MGPAQGSPNLALAIYAKAMDRRDGEPERLVTLVGVAYRATTGNQTEVGQALAHEVRGTAA
jgi:hypothetical protein